MSVIANPWNRIGKEAVWVIGSQALVMLASLVALRQLTELLPEAEYGQAYLFINGVGLILHLFVAPLSQAANRFYHESLSAHTLNFILGFVWRVQSVVILTVCAVYMAIVLSQGQLAGSYSIAYGILPFYFALTGFQQIVIGLLNISRRRPLYASLQIADAWLRPVFALLLGWFWRADANAVLLGYALASTMTGSVSLIILGRMGTYPPYRLPLPSRQQMARVLVYAAPFAGFAVPGWILSLSDRYIINGLLGTEETGLYVAGYQVGSQVFLITAGLFSTLVQPILFQSASRDHKEGQQALSDWARLFVWYTTPVLIGFFLLKDWLLRWLVAPGYWDAASVVGLVGLGNYFLVVANYAATAFFITERPDRLLWGYSFSAAVNVVLNFALIPYLGIQGAAISTCVGYGCYAGLCVVLGRKQLPWQIPWDTFLVVWLGLGIAGTLAYEVNSLMSLQQYELVSFLVTLGTFALGIILFIWLTRSMVLSDLTAVSRHL